MTELDPRLNAFRGDLADEALKGQVKAPRFVQGLVKQVARGVADLRRAPDEATPLDSQLLFGETVTVFEEKDGWAWVQNVADGYVGYTPAAALDAGRHDPTHQVAVARTFLYPEPNLKAPPVDWLSIASHVAVVGERQRFSALASGGFVYTDHLLGPGEHREDYVETALGLVGLPYLWGGRSSLGLDCSALVQLSLALTAGRGDGCRRDSEQQVDSLGQARPIDIPPERGDLIYFPGHVAIALDATMVVNANAHHMLVTVERLADLTARVIAESGRGITAIRRLPDIDAAARASTG